MCFRNLSLARTYRKYLVRAYGKYLVSIDPKMFIVSPNESWSNIWRTNQLFWQNIYLVLVGIKKSRIKIKYLTTFVEIYSFLDENMCSIRIYCNICHLLHRCFCVFFFAKTVNDLKLLIIFAKLSIWDDWLDSEWMLYCPL